MSTYIKKIFFGIITCSIFLSVNADDIDLINIESSRDSNILFVLDLSGSMNYGLSPDSNTDAAAGETSRIDTLRDAFQIVIDLPAFKNTNFGLSVFSGNAQSNIGKGMAHGITFPVSKVTEVDAQVSLNANTNFLHKGSSYLPATGTNLAGENKNTREYLGLLSADTATWSAGGSTPIVDALYEAAVYFRGEEPKYGRYLPSDFRSAHPSTYTGSLALTSTTTPAECDVRENCAKGSCGLTEECSDTTVMVQSPTDNGSCTPVTGARENCPSGEASCGASTNCTTTTQTKNRYCWNSSDVGACETAHTDWFNCQVETYTDSSTNSEGETTFIDKSRVKCNQEVTTTQCDSVDTFSCPTEVESCSKCPDDITTEEITGSIAYKTPITQECHSNGIVFLTDGKPTSNQSTTLAKSLMGRSEDCTINDYDGDLNDDFNDSAGRCGVELAEFLATTDQNTTLSGDQVVNTSTIGLSVDRTSNTGKYLLDIADKGEGVFATAETPEELAEALVNAATIVPPKARSFSSPSFSVDSSTNLSVGDYVYVPMFDRRGNIWPGNLKKFKLVDGELMGIGATAGSTVSVLDADGVIINEARDFWSTAAGVDSVTSGGAANKIIPISRVIKTDNGSALIDLNDSIANSEFDLSSSVTDDQLKINLIKYIKGSNADDTPRNHMGDIIHSIPIQLEYSDGKRIIFVGTNEGFLHAINDVDGTEAYAYMPSELLPNINTQYSGGELNSHVYGVDSPITLWLDESNSSVSNGVLDSGEQAYLFFGLRRGGKGYYALNVTDPAAPSLAWKLTDSTPSRPELTVLGNTWSQPVLANLKWGSNLAPKPVIIFGGGFIDDTTGIEQAGGNRVYIVDAEDGSAVWSSKTAEDASLVYGGTLSNGIPGKIRVLDVDRNGSIDRLYFTDTGANIWRVDLNAGNFTGIAADAGDVSKAKIFKFASLGGAGIENRKFFEEPDVAIFKSGGELVTSIAIGSGDRPNPLDASVSNHFFVLYDKNVLSTPAVTPTAPSPITLTDLDTLPVTTAETKAADYNGWYKSLTSNTGEKVLSTAVTYRNKVLFTTLGTTSVIADTCSPNTATEARLYVLDLALGAEDANVAVATGEILGTPTIVFDYQSASGGACDVQDCQRSETIYAGKTKVTNVLSLPTLTAGEVAPGSLPRVYWIDNE